MSSHILTNATDEQLGLAVFENLYDLFRSMARLLDGELSENDKLSQHITFPTNPIVQRSMGNSPFAR